MVELLDSVITELKREGKTMTTDDVIRLVERHHDDGPGVGKDTLRAYAVRLDDERDFTFDVAGFVDEIDDRLTASDEWTGADALYQLDGERVSLYPERWHRDLGGSVDPAAYVRFLQSEVPEFENAAADLEVGVPKHELEDVVSLVGRTDLEEARLAIERQRRDGTLVEDADQHKNAGVYLADDAENLRDTSSVSKSVDKRTER